MEHNLSVAWIRLWSTVGAAYYADTATISYSEREAEIAVELAKFEIRRFATVCYACEAK